MGRGRSSRDRPRQLRALPGSPFHSSEGTRETSLGRVSIPGLWGRDSCQAHHRPRRPGSPTKLCVAFSPTRVSFPQVPVCQASCHHPPCAKMGSHHPLLSFDENKTVGLTDMNDAEGDPSSSSHGLQNVWLQLSATLVPSSVLLSVCLPHPPSPGPGATWLVWLARPEPRGRLCKAWGHPGRASSPGPTRC